MPAGPDIQSTLVAIIANNIAGNTLRDIVASQNVVRNFDDLRKALPPDPADAKMELARQLVATYAASNQLGRLVRELIRRSRADDVTFSLLYQIAHADLDQARGGLEAKAENAKQAALVMRANTLQHRALRLFMDEVEAHLCAVVSVSDRITCGTGILVGPDLVLTAYHTVSPHIDVFGKALPGDQEQFLFAVFDHLEGEPIVDSHPPQGTVEVRFHKDWLVCNCKDMPRDGQFERPDAAQEALLQEHLDFALVRLDKPIGRHARRVGGGRARAWCALTDDRWENQCRQDDRIIIPQHPHGLPQRIDFGRYCKEATDVDSSSTRLRYTTETDMGTSGAPCFNQHFKFVGLHNAVFVPSQGCAHRNPSGGPQHNQAIRAGCIVPRIRGFLSGNSIEPPRPVWRTSQADAAPRSILGRDCLLRWIERASEGTLTEARSQRVYAALGHGSGIGKSFSSEILTAARRAYADPIVILGNGDQIPSTLADFVASIAYQLRIEHHLLGSMPGRPQGNSSLQAASVGGAADSLETDLDKLQRWASDDVPLWFDRILAAHRVRSIDVAAEARTARSVLETLGHPVSDEIRRAAEGPETIEQRVRFERAWIVLDNLQDANWSTEVRDFVAGMVGGQSAESVVPVELRRLRWLFLGSVPDFLTKDATIETLDPLEIDKQHLINNLAAIAGDFAQPSQLDMYEAQIVAYMSDDAVAPRLADAGNRLRILQKYLDTLSAFLVQKCRSRT